jgi:hypothetical protein
LLIRFARLIAATFRLVNLRGSNQSFYFVTLRRIGWQAAEELLGGRGSFGATTKTCKCNRQVETCLMEAGIEGERSLKRFNGVSWATAVRQNDAEVR